jgi:hypothetical protein
MNQAEKNMLNMGMSVRVLDGQTKTAADNAGLGPFVAFEPDVTSTVRLVSETNPTTGSTSADGSATGAGSLISGTKRGLFSSITVTTGPGVAYYAAP